MPTPEEIIRNLQRQSTIRGGQDRNALLQRQRQMQQAQQQIQQQQEAQRRLEAQRRQQEQQSSGNDEVRQYNYGRKLALSGKGAYGLTGIERQGYIDAKEGLNAVEKYKQAVKEFKAQELTGVTAQSQVSQGLFQGPIPQAPAGREYSEQLFRATGQLKQVKPTLYQGPVQRFTDPEYFTETGKKRQLPLVVSGVNQGTFQTDIKRVGQDIKTAYQQNDLPQIVRSTLGTGTSVLFREGVRKTEQGLKNIGVGQDSPLFRQTSFQTSRVVGDVALGSLLVGLSGSSQIAVSRYVKNGVVYEIDSAGNVIASRPLSQVNKEITDFRQALEESSIFKKAGSSYYNEPNLRERTRELINRASPEQLKSLKELYKKSARLDLFDDILAQEKDIAVRTNIQSKATAKAIKDTPSQLTGAGQITSQFAGTGQYERTDMVAGGIPQGKIQNPSLLSNPNVAFGQSSFNRNRLAQLSQLGLKLQTKQATQQINQLGLRQPQETKISQRLSSGLASALSTAQKTQQQQRLVQRQALDFFRNRARRQGFRPRGRFGFDLPSSDTLGKNKLSTKDILGFAVEVRRRGKFNVLATEQSLERALRKGSRIADVTLARSFRLRRLDTGELVDISQLPIGFRRSKREAKTFVEESRFALSTGGEKGEIKYFKNIKGKRRRLI